MITNTYYVKILQLIILLSLTTLLHAQVTKPLNKPLAKQKVPTVTAYIGGNVSGTYNVAAAKVMIDSALVIKDEKGKSYSIYKFTFLYKRRMEYTDEDTREKIVTWEYLSKELRNNEQLDELWRTTIKQDLKKGEQLLFEGILADSKKGYMLVAKSIIITIQ